MAPLAPVMATTIFKRNPKLQSICQEIKPFHQYIAGRLCCSTLPAPGLQQCAYNVHMAYLFFCLKLPTDAGIFLRSLILSTKSEIRPKVKRPVDTAFPPACVVAC